jgi:hypothetical protein
VESVIRWLLIVGGVVSTIIGVFWRWLVDRDNAALMTAVATLGLVFVAFLQWRTLQKTDETLKATLNLAHRPWVGVEKIETRSWPTTQADGKVHLDLSVTLKNVGKSPAVVLVSGGAILSTEDWKPKQKKRCADTKSAVQRSGFGDEWTVLPDQLWPYHISLLLETPLSELKKMAGMEFVIRIVGCVVYRSTFDDAIYTTSFVAMTSVEDPKLEEPRGVLHPIKVSDLGAPAKDRWVIIKDLSMAGESPR